MPHGRPVRRLLLTLLLAVPCACTGGDALTPPDTVPVTGPPSVDPPLLGSDPAATWDLDRLGVPRFIAADYIQSERIPRISRFRSGSGHDYSDSVEHCRSMKHYFDVSSLGADAASLAISAPVSGLVVRAEPEQTFGTQLQIRPDAYPAFTVVLFHVVPSPPLAEGDRVRAGAVIGHHVGSQTNSDVAVSVMTPAGYRLVSYFDALADSVWARYAARGVTDRAAMVITRAERDADPLVCDSEAFRSTGTLSNWVELK